MSKNKKYLALDVGEKRIGAAVGESGVRIAVPFDTIGVDGKELERIAEIVIKQDIDAVIVGYPRNQFGEATAQTAYVETFAKQLRDIAPRIYFQDESLTSVLAEQQLKISGKPYGRADIDAQAAALILQDYLEQLA